MSSWSSVVVNDSCLIRVSALPSENKPPLLVDPDAPASFEITIQALKPVAGRYTHIIDGLGVVELDQPPSGSHLEIRRKLSTPCASKYLFSFLASEGLDHQKKLPYLVSDATLFFGTTLVVFNPLLGARFRHGVRVLIFL